MGRFYGVRPVEPSPGTESAQGQPRQATEFTCLPRLLPPLTQGLEIEAQQRTATVIQNWHRGIPSPETSKGLKRLATLDLQISVASMEGFFSWVCLLRRTLRGKRRTPCKEAARSDRSKALGRGFSAPAWEIRSANLERSRPPRDGGNFPDFGSLHAAGVTGDSAAELPSSSTHPVPSPEQGELSLTNSQTKSKSGKVVKTEKPLGRVLPPEAAAGAMPASWRWPWDWTRSPRAPH